MSRVNHYLNETGTCNLHKTRHATTRHVLLHRRHGHNLHEAWLLLLHTYIDYQQKSTRISYWTYGHTGSCITRGMTILYFQFTLYIAGIVTGIACTFSQSQFVNQVVVHCYNNTDNFFKKYILHII